VPTVHSPTRTLLPGLVHSQTRFRKLTHITPYPTLIFLNVGTDEWDAGGPNLRETWVRSGIATELESIGRSGNLALAGLKLVELENEVHHVMETLEELSRERIE
jgi:hypothetical protein